LSEENCWELAAGGLSAAAAPEERSSASLESTDFSEAEQGSTDPSDNYSEEKWEDFRKRMGCNEHLTWKGCQDLQTRLVALAAAEAVATMAEEAAAAAEAAAALAAEMKAAMTESVDVAGPGNGNAHSRRLEWRAAEAVDNERSWSVDSRPQRRRRRLKSRLRSREPTWRSMSREPGAFLEDKEGEGSSKLPARPTPSTLGK
jgi:hypothetical protein